jgi:hypothetical protein
MRKVIIAVCRYIISKLMPAHQKQDTTSCDVPVSTSLKRNYPTGVKHPRKYKGCKVMAVTDFVWVQFPTQTAAAAYLTEKCGVAIKPYMISNALNRGHKFLYKDGVSIATVSWLED